MNTKLILLGLLLLTLVNCAVLSQELPKVIPPTPEAASLFKYLDYPVDYGTGLPQISIPLYEVKSGSLTVPISINYHSSGRKVYDETGAVGLGWTLMAGGMISRTIYGDPDDNDYVVKFPMPWKKQADINPATAADADFLDGVVENLHPMQWYDTEYDFFSYSMNSISGKFIFRDDNNVKVPVLIPKKPYKIEYHKTTGNPSFFDYLGIIDEKGIHYKFGAGESSGSGFSSWLLTEIISADKADTIFFEYQSFSKNKRTISQNTTVRDQWTDMHNSVDVTPAEGYATDDELGTNNDVNYNVQRIVKIKFRNGTVNFNLATGTDLIQSIHIKSASNQVVRKIEFSQSVQDVVSDGNPPTKKLDFLVVKDAADNSSEKYTFDYFPTTFGGGTSVVNGRSRDLWGYYNASGSLMMRPVIENIQCNRAFITEYITIGDVGSYREPNESALKSGVLQKITFPTGGSTEFVYERNKYNNTTTYGPGLRLLQSITNDGNGTNSTRTYKYGVSESGYGTLPLVPSLSNMSYETKHLNYKQPGEPGIPCSSSCPEVFYRNRVYSADVLPIFSEFHQRPVFYEEVTEYHGTLSDNIGKTVYKYDMGNQLGFPNSVGGLFVNSDLKHWKQSSLIEKKDFKKVGSSYQLAKKTVNTYLETVYSAEKVWGLHAGMYFFRTPINLLNSSGQNVPSYRYEMPTNLPGGTVDVFRFSDYTISVGKKELASTAETLVDDLGYEFTTTTNYLYNSNHLLATSTGVTSTEQNSVTENKYPFDFPSDPVHTNMINRNMLDYTVENNTYRNSTPLISTKTTYKVWDGNMIKPEIISTRQGTAAYEQRLVFHAYDELGNMLSVSKSGDTQNSYIYGYKKQFPIAEITNANNTKYSKSSISQSTETQGITFGGSTSGTIQTTKIITVDYTGTVYLRLGVSTSPWYSTVLNYSGITSGSVTLNTGGCGSTVVPFTNVAPGTYTLTLTLTTPDSGVPSLGACGNVEYPDNATVVTTTGYNECFYESFEEGSVTGTINTHTGKKYLVGDYAPTFTLPNGKSYVIEYWYWNGAEWVHISKPYTGTSTPVNEGDAIDDVRIYPTDARMKSYTYDPMVGISSVIDENGAAMIYDYDTFGRLLQIRNDKGGIEKQYTYHYKTN